MKPFGFILEVIMKLLQGNTSNIMQYKMLFYGFEYSLMSLATIDTQMGGN